MSQQPSNIFQEQPPHRYAGFAERLGAYLIDTLILAVPCYYLNRVLGYDTLGRFSHSYGFAGMFSPAMSYSNLGGIVLSWVYYAAQESGPTGATLGKRALGIQVVGPDGGRISFANATGRHFGKLLSTLILLIGYLMVIWDAQKQSLHDRLANTFVVKD